MLLAALLAAAPLAGQGHRSQDCLLDQLTGSWKLPAHRCDPLRAIIAEIELR